MLVVMVTLMAALLIQGGLVLWKLASSQLPPFESTKPLPLLKALFTNRLWVLGWLACNLGWAFCIKAVAMGTISVVEPLLSTGDFFLVILSLWLVGERLKRSEMLGIALVIVGEIVFSLNVIPVPPAEIVWPNVALAVTAVLVAASFSFWLAMRRRYKMEIMLGVTAGLVASAGACLTKLMTTYLALAGRDDTLIGFVWNPIFPLVVIVSLSALYFVQLGFQHGRASVIVPVHLSVVNLLVFVYGITLFNEEVTAAHLGGLALITVGVYLLQANDKLEKVGSDNNA